MKAVVTRVRSAEVSIDGRVCGAIGRGFLILLGVARDDTPELCRKLAEKIIGLRIFRDAPPGAALLDLRHELATCPYGVVLDRVVVHYCSSPSSLSGNWA